MTAPYYSDDLVTLYHGAALEVLRSLGAESVDITVTSPPYNMGLSPGGNGRGMYTHTTSKASRFSTEGYTEAGDDALDSGEYATLRTLELWEMYRVSRSSVWWNHRPRIIHGLMTDPLDALRRDSGRNLPPLRQRIILARPTGIDVNRNHFATRGEYLHLFAKPAFALVDHAASGMGDVWKIEETDDADLTDVWDVPIVSGSDHPAPFHESIPERCIRATGATSILDPFTGSGTTLAVAKRLGIRAIGIERDERYCEMTAARLGSWEHSVAHAGSLWEVSP